MNDEPTNGIDIQPAGIENPISLILIKLRSK
jgi:hypothetical protein